MDKRLLDILCCPATKAPLRFLSDAELALVNRAIVAEQVRNGAGTQVAATLSSGLITRDARTIYRVDDDIPVMLVDESIATSQLTDFPRP